MVNHDTVLRRVEMQAVRAQAKNDKRRAIIDAANKRQLMTERGQVKARINTMAPGIQKVLLAHMLVAIKKHLSKGMIKKAQK